MSLLVLGHEVEGLAAALALAHQGFPVHLLDRGGDPRDPAATRTGPVALSPQATRQLAVLGLFDRVAPHASMPCRLVQADAVSGEVLRRAELGHGVVTRYGYPFLLARRATLRGLLAAACEADEMITIEYARPATSVDDLGDGVLVTCENGASYRTEALVGADGPASPVRRVLGAGPGMSPPHVRFDAPGPATGSSEIRLWSSPDVHVVQAPVPGGTEVSVVLRVDPNDEMRHVATGEMLARVLARHHDDVRGVVGGVLDAVPSQVHRHHAPLPDARHPRMTVTGAAATPMLPHTARATGLALVDACALGRAFDRADGRIADALTSYVEARRSVWAREAEQARDFATLCHADGLVRRIRDRLWANAPLDEMAAIVGSVTGEAAGGSAGSER